MDEATLHELLSGRRTDLGSRLLRSVLHIASWVYASAMTLRNLAYRKKWLSIHQASVPVISLGNITTGGTGKTPFAAWLANWLIAENHHPGLLSRGYRALEHDSSIPDSRHPNSPVLNQSHNADTPTGLDAHRANDTPLLNPSSDAHRPARPAPIDQHRANDTPILNPSSDAHRPAVPAPVPEAFDQHRANDTPILNPSSDAHRPAVPVPGNDEKLVLDRLCPGVPHLQQRDRVDSARRIVHEFGCDVLLLDDGFQHRRLHRDLDLVLIDALQPWGYGQILPRGLLREPLSGLRRADLILITRADQCSSDQRRELLSQLRRIRGTDEWVEIAFRPSRLVDLNWQDHPLSSVMGKKAYSFCGIGNPAGFRKTVESLGAICKTTKAYPDHHHYNEQDLADLAEAAREMSAEVVLTTQKDLVKIPVSAWTGPPLRAVEIGVQFLSGIELLESKLRALFATKIGPEK